MSFGKIARMNAGPDEEENTAFQVEAEKIINDPKNMEEMEHRLQHLSELVKHGKFVSLGAGITPYSSDPAETRSTELILSPMIEYVTAEGKKMLLILVDYAIRELDNEIPVMGVNPKES